MSEIRKVLFAATAAVMAVSVVTCDRAPVGASSLPPIGVLFSTGVPDDTACGEGLSWGASQGHYNSTFSVQEEGVATCGGLAFEGQTGLWRTYYDFSTVHSGQWSTWRRRARSAPTGSYTDSIAQHAQLDADSVDIPFVLEFDFDLVGLTHDITQDSALPDPDADPEAWAQIWRSIGTPSIDSFAARIDTVQVVFVNNSRGREIDSTRVERRASGSSLWELRGFAVADGSIFVDVGAPPGTYVYRLKHVTTPILLNFGTVPPHPNSGWSPEDSVMVGFPPPSLHWCDDTLVPSAECHWSNGTDTAQIEVERDGVHLMTLPAGTTISADSAVAFDSTYSYRVRHTAPTAQSEWSDPRTQAVVADAPRNLLCNSGTGEVEVGCGWSPEEPTDTTELWRRPDGSAQWSVLAKVAPTLSHYIDQDVVEGATYWYRARHRRNSVVTAFSNEDSATVTTDPGPLPAQPTAP